MYKTINEHILSKLVEDSGEMIYSKAERIYVQMDFLTPMVPQEKVDDIIENHFVKGSYLYYF